MQKQKLHIQQGWLTSARKIHSPHFDLRPDEQDISLLIIHYISLPPEQFGKHYIDDFFQGKLDCNAHPYFAQLKDVRVSAHCLINRQGEITQYVNFNHRAWHAGASQFEGREKCNDFSIGIELEGSNEQPFTEAQYESLTLLTKQIMQSYPNITAKRIVGHCDVAPGRKSDPGQHFNWQKYLQSIVCKD
ncbi:1,6-anhydro-N-acetylmuramyl-L-alanine amidase AmpD [[Haemophilus] felis]|nr:1,6-anhydro-N-acetylmuramyl-L-alanine amidase AmpD [[Haemophilus] felis]